MSDDPGPSPELERLRERLRELAAELREPGLDDERAAVLAAEAAELVGGAGAAIERALNPD